MVRYLNLADHNPRRITKARKDFGSTLHFKGTKFPVKIRDIRKIEKKRKKKENSIGISVFSCESKKNKNIQSMYQRKILQKKHVDLLLIGEGEKKHYDLIKGSNRFMYDHSLHRGRKHFCRYCFHAFITEEILKRHIKDCFKINGKKQLRFLRKANTLNSKVLKEK